VEVLRAVIWFVVGGVVFGYLLFVWVEVGCWVCEAQFERGVVVALIGDCCG